MAKKDRQFHEDEAQCNVDQAKTFSALADAHNACAEAMGDNDNAADAHRSAAKACNAISDSHTQSASRHIECCKAACTEDELDKADEGGERSDLKKLLDRVNLLLKQTIPNGVSVIPLLDNPRAVTRAGQPTEKERLEAQKAIEKVAPELSNVLFAKEAAG
jgi:hypothetical protein